MRRLNFLEAVGLATLAFPFVAAAAVGGLLITGTIRLYREQEEKGARKPLEGSPFKGDVPRILAQVRLVDSTR